MTELDCIFMSKTTGRWHKSERDMLKDEINALKEYI